MYIFHHKKHGYYQAFTNLKALADYTLINYDTLKYQFTRMKRDRYEIDEIVIVRTDPKKSKRIK